MERVPADAHEGLGNMLGESEQPEQKACLGCYNQMGDFH